MNNGPEPVADMKRILAPFERSTGINVNVQLVGWDVQYQRITNAAISGEAPDVAGRNDAGSVLRGAERLREPRDRVDRIGGRKAYAGGIWATTQLAGKPGVWSVPWFTEARTIYYRKDVYKRAGVNPQTAFKTWASFRAALLKLRSVRNASTASRSCRSASRARRRDLVHHIMPFVWGAGGAELTKNHRSSAIASPQAIRGVKYFSDLVPRACS